MRERETKWEEKSLYAIARQPSMSKDDDVLFLMLDPDDDWSLGWTPEVEKACTYETANRACSLLRDHWEDICSLTPKPKIVRVDTSRCVTDI